MTSSIVNVDYKVRYHGKEMPISINVKNVISIVLVVIVCN